MIPEIWLLLATVGSTEVILEQFPGRWDCSVQAPEISRNNPQAEDLRCVKFERTPHFIEPLKDRTLDTPS